MIRISTERTVSKGKVVEKISKVFFSTPVITTIKYDTYPPTTKKYEGLSYKLKKPSAGEGVQICVIAV